MTRDEVVAAARDWLGVPFLHQGRSRAGVDCAGLVICVARGLGELPEGYDVNGYRRAPDGSMLRECDARLVPISGLEAGAVAMMRFSEEPQHLAFVAPYRHGGFALIHALQKSGRVVEHRLDPTWRGRIVRLFRFPGVD